MTTEEVERYRKNLESKGVSHTTIIDGNHAYVVTKNLLANFVIRDPPIVQSSFDLHYSAELKGLDEWFSDAALLFFLATRPDEHPNEDFKSTLLGLVNNMLNTFGAATTLLRSGLPDQSLVLVRQVIEIASTIIHLVGDPENKAYANFKKGKYSSTKAVSRATKAIPILASLWGFLSNNFVHITDFHSGIRPVRPYEADSEAVKTVITNLRLTIWICFLATEIAFPTLGMNRYWKLQKVDGRDAMAFEPDAEEERKYRDYLGLQEEDDVDVDLSGLKDSEDGSTV